MRYRAKNGSVVLPFNGAPTTIKAVDTDSKDGAALFKQIGKAAVEEHFEIDLGDDQFTRVKGVEQATAAPGEKRGAKR